MSINAKVENRKTHKETSKTLVDDAYTKQAMLSAAKLIARRSKVYNSKNWRMG